MRKQIQLLIYLFLFISFPVLAQEPVDLETVYKIKQEGFNNSKVRENSQVLTDFIGPRLSGSTNIKRSHQWLKNKLEEYGLENIQIEPWGEFGKGWETEKSYVAMTVPYYQPLIATPKAWTPGTNGPVESEVILLKIKSDSDLEKYRGKLKGKIVAVPSTAEVKTTFEAEAKRYTDEELVNLVSHPEIGTSSSYYSPERLTQYRTQRELNEKINKFLLEEEVAILIKGTRGSFGTVFHSTGGSYAANAAPALPELEMSLEHFGRITRLIETGKEVRLELEVKNKFLTDDLQGYNVIGEIVGTDKKLKPELVMLGAHIDSWHAGTGANDNAAGVIIMLEAVRILKEIGIKPKRTIRIAFWGEEEQGLYGSRNYITKYFGDPQNELKPDHAKLSAYYNLDNGSGKIRGIYTQGNDALKNIFEAWFNPFHDLGAKTITNRNTGSTDHVAFDRVGLPGFQFIQDPIDYDRGYHTNMDLFERLQIGDMMQASVIVASIVYHTAQRAEKLPRKPLPKRIAAN
jgi:carboxypeptidase Q